MKPMSDKELDKLFQQSFEGFEVQPSADSWQKISAELPEVHQIKKQRKLPIFWMAAASIIIIGVFAVLFQNQPEKIQLRAKVQKSDSSNLIVSAKNSSNQVKNSIQKQSLKATENSNIKTQISSDKPLQNNVSEDLPQTQFLASTQTEESSAKEAIQKTTVAGIKKVKNVTLSTLQVPVKEEALACAVEKEIPNLAGLEKTETNTFRRNRVKNVGDLVNLVISKVDKRDDKIIEFKHEDDEESSSVTGLNLGIIKYKNLNK